MKRLIFLSMFIPSLCFAVPPGQIEKELDAVSREINRIRALLSVYNFNANLKTSNDSVGFDDLPASKKTKLKAQIEAQIVTMKAAANAVSTTLTTPTGGIGGPGPLVP